MDNLETGLCDLCGDTDVPLDELYPCDCGASCCPYCMADGMCKDCFAEAEDDE